jgi:hypothetical protein
LERYKYITSDRYFVSHLLFIHESAADEFLVLAQHALRAGAFLVVVSKVTARAGILSM